jgi:FPC/CPF motif-containing protein YcgG
MNPIEAAVSAKTFPCSGAKTALSLGLLRVVEARDLRCPADDAMILAQVYQFIAAFVQAARNGQDVSFRSFAVTFAGPVDLDEAAFEQAMWARLQALHDLDRVRHAWSEEASADPADPRFSFSLGGRAFYVVGMHPHSSRPARRAAQPALVFNLHAQFEALRADGRYETMQRLIRRRDRQFNGSVNPMLADFGARSEARQYSGRAVEEDWVCPFRRH